MAKIKTEGLDEGPEIRLDQGGILRFWFHGAESPFNVAPVSDIIDISRESFILFCGFAPEQVEDINRAWMWWTTFTTGEFGKASRWWESSAFLRDGIRVKVEMK